MDLGEAVRVAGIGCRRGAGAAEILAAVRAANGEGALDALATVPAKAGEPGLAEAARSLGLPLMIGATAPDDDRIHTASPASLAATNLPSVCESAALAAVGGDGRLIGSRLVLGRVTCAVAVSGGLA